MNSASFSPDGLKVVTASEDKTARVWDARTGQSLTEPLKHDATVWSASFSPEGLRVVTASDDATARVWDARTGQPLTEPLKHQGSVNSASFSPDGLRLVTASGIMVVESGRLMASGAARVWDARTGQPLTEPLKHDSLVRSASFSPDGLRVVTASDDATARAWDARTGQPLTEPLKQDAVVRSASFSPDGLRVVTASDDKTARVWDARTGRSLTESLKHNGGVDSASFSPDGLWVVTASQDKTARVWDARTGRSLTEPLKHDSFVRSASFSPEGLRVVTASMDKTARVWDARTGQPLTEPLMHNDQVNSASFSPDGLRVVTASDDGFGRIWDLPPGGTVLPAALANLAEALAEWRLNERRVLEAVPLAEARKILERAKADRRDDPFHQWQRWLLAEPDTRTVSPNSAMTFTNYVQRLVERGTEDSLRQVLFLSPTNGLALAKLAHVLAQASGTNSSLDAGQALFLSQRALKLAPDDPEIRRLHRETLHRLGGTQP